MSADIDDTMVCLNDDSSNSTLIRASSSPGLAAVLAVVRCSRLFKLCLVGK